MRSPGGQSNTNPCLINASLQPRNAGFCLINAVLATAQTSWTFYNQALQATNVVQPDGPGLTNEYFLSGELKKTWGARVYPTGYAWDSQGREIRMTNWGNYAADSGRRVTYWKYDLYRGWVTNKTYDGGSNGPTYTYTDAGRLASRLWARGTNTTYAYNFAGDLAGTTYNDSGTPALTYG
jgi:YD repeat-containing protein